MKKAESFFISLLLLLPLLSPLSVFAQGNFNVEISLPNSYKSVSAGEEIWFTVKTVNLGSENRVDITLNYQIIGLNNEVISSKSQTLAIETQASFVGRISLPENASPGKYALKVTLNPIGASSVAQSQVTFDVVAKKTDAQTIKYIYILLAAVLGIILLAYIFIKLSPIFKKIAIRSEVRRIVKKKI